MLFDTHAHYYASAFNEDRDEVLSSLPGEGVGLVLCPGNDLWSSRRCIEMAEQYPYIYAAAGIHPEDALNLPEDWLAQIEEMAAHPSIPFTALMGWPGISPWTEEPGGLRSMGSPRVRLD